MKNSFNRTIVAGLLALPALCSAALVDRGGGLLYDDVLNITWLQDANYAKTSNYDADGLMSWASANAWAAQLNYGGIGGWRLPTVKPIGSDWNLNVSYDGSSDVGYNKNTANDELAFMYFNNLGLKSAYTPSGSFQHGGTGLTGYSNDIGLVHNLIAYAYWTATAAPLPFAGIAFDFYVAYGLQDYTFQITELHAWAVHDGDIAIINRTPEPASSALLIAALAGLLGCQQRLRRT